MRVSPPLDLCAAAPLLLALDTMPGQETSTACHASKLTCRSSLPDAQMQMSCAFNCMEACLLGAFVLLHRWQRLHPGAAIRSNAALFHWACRDGIRHERVLDLSNGPRPPLDVNDDCWLFIVPLSWPRYYTLVQISTDLLHFTRGGHQGLEPLSAQHAQLREVGVVSTRIPWYDNGAPSIITPPSWLACTNAVT